MSKTTSNRYPAAPYSERLVCDPSDVNGAFAFLKTQDATEILRAAQAAPDIIRKDTGPAQGRYLGTVPILLAEVWAKECGAAIGTREWAVYAKKKLSDPNFKKLRVHS